MPKLKTNKAAAKRYSYTASGKVKRTSANSRHRLATKTKRQTLQYLSFHFSDVFVLPKNRLLFLLR